MVVIKAWLHLEDEHTSSAENGRNRAGSGALGQRMCRHTRTKRVGTEGQMTAISNRERHAVCMRHAWHPDRRRDGASFCLYGDSFTPEPGAAREPIGRRGRRRRVSHAADEVFHLSRAAQHRRSGSRCS